jgi:hypothetical protein
MAEPIVITVSFDPQSLSPNQRIHWRERARRTKAARALALWKWALAKRPVADGPVEVSLLVRRGRLIDPDGALAGCKPILDGLLSQKRNHGDGVTPDDSAAFVRYLPVEFETGREWQGREQVVVTIVPVETR